MVVVVVKWNGELLKFNWKKSFWVIVTDQWPLGSMLDSTTQEWVETIKNDKVEILMTVQAWVMNSWANIMAKVKNVEIESSTIA